MGTRSVIARPTPEGGFHGTYCHYDGYPAHQGRILFDAVTGHFAGDSDAACTYLIDEHPAGWSVLHGDFTTPPGYRLSTDPDDLRNQCYCLKGAQTRSCSSAVLVEESAEQVASTHGAPVILGADGRPGQRIWWSQPECPVGTVAVVMLDIDPEDLLQVAAANDQQPVQALGADGPNPALGVGVGLWRPDWGHQDVGVL
jgi:hypothetical protein